MLFDQSYILSVQLACGYTWMYALVPKENCNAFAPMHCTSSHRGPQKLQLVPVAEQHFHTKLASFSQLCSPDCFCMWRCVQWREITWQTWKMNQYSRNTPDSCLWWWVMPRSLPEIVILLQRMCRGKRFFFAMKCCVSKVVLSLLK